MKRTAIITTLLTLIQSLYAADLTVTVSNIKEVKGNIVIGIFNCPNAFPCENKELKQIIIPVNANEVSKTVSLPKGIYAIALFHDKNENNKCDRNFLGIPTEGIGFSNNFKPKMKAPTFDDVKVTVKQDTNMCIKLLHF